jgi:hypothetical protein
MNYEEAEAYGGLPIALTGAGSPPNVFAGGGAVTLVERAQRPDPRGGLPSIRITRHLLDQTPDRQCSLLAYPKWLALWIEQERRSVQQAAGQA